MNGVQDTQIGHDNVLVGFKMRLQLVGMAFDFMVGVDVNLWVQVYPAVNDVKEDVNTSVRLDNQR